MKIELLQVDYHQYDMIGKLIDGLIEQMIEVQIIGELLILKD
jgi:hypothetical protein